MFETIVLLKPEAQADPAVIGRILDAAVSVFAERGFDGANLRELTRKARANLAAVSYYFHGKKGLYREVIERRLRPIDRDRSARLAAFAVAGGAPPTVEQIVRSFLDPLIAVHRDPARGGPALVRLFIRLSLDPPDPLVGGDFADDQRQTLTRFAQAFRRHAPSLPPDEFLWRFTFLVGAANHALLNLRQMPALTLGICRIDDYDGLLARLADLSASVLSAPAR